VFSGSVLLGRTFPFAVLLRDPSPLPNKDRGGFFLSGGGPSLGFLSPSFDGLQDPQQSPLLEPCPFHWPPLGRSPFFRFWGKFPNPPFSLAKSGKGLVTSRSFLPPNLTAPFSWIRVVHTDFTFVFFFILGVTLLRKSLDFFYEDPPLSVPFLHLDHLGKLVLFFRDALSFLKFSRVSPFFLALRFPVAWYPWLETPLVPPPEFRIKRFDGKVTLGLNTLLFPKSHSFPPPISLTEETLPKFFTGPFFPRHLCFLSLKIPSFLEKYGCFSLLEGLLRESGRVLGDPKGPIPLLAGTDFP